MKVIDQNTEILILKELVKLRPSNSGSSRVVYIIHDTSVELIDLLLKSRLLDNETRCDDFVIKVAMGIGGQVQMQREVNAYCNCDENYPLAKIFAAGRFIEIMEYVHEFDLIDTRDIYSSLDYDNKYNVFAANYGFHEELNADRINSWGDYNYDDYPIDAKADDIEEYEKILEVFSYLCDLFGDTSDNGQIGYNQSGEIVCYDYGFEPDSNDTWSSGLTDFLYSKETREEILLTYIEDLTQYDNLDYSRIDGLEHDLIHNLNLMEEGEDLQWDIEAM